MIPWDEIADIYYKNVERASTGHKSLNPRIVVGSLIIKYLCRLDDREVVDQFSENIYMQYFPGYPSFVNEKPFDASLFVEIRKRLGMETINEINERIVKLKAGFESKDKTVDNDSGDQKGDDHIRTEPVEQADGLPEGPPVTHKGKVIFDATACPQDIAYPTDPDLLSDARQKSEEPIDLLYDKFLREQKPRIYRQSARREYPATAQKRKKTKKQIRSAIRKQLGYLGRNIRSIHGLLDAYGRIPLTKRVLKYFYVIRTLYDQQLLMYRTRTYRVDDRIVSISCFCLGKTGHFYRSIPER